MLALKIQKSSIHFLCYLILAFLTCYLMYADFVASDLRAIPYDPFGLFRAFPTDSQTYYNFAAGIEQGDFYRNRAIVGLIRIFNFNFIAIFLFQFLMFAVLVFFLLKNKLITPLFLYLSIPLLTISAIFPNKDFYTICSLISLVLWNHKRQWGWLCLALVFASVARLELLFVVLFFFAVVHFRFNHKLAIVSILLVISMFYEGLYRVEDYRFVLESGLDCCDFSGAKFLDDLARLYNIYIVVFPFKVIAAIKDGGAVALMVFLPLLILAFMVPKRTALKFLLILFLLYSTFPAFPHFRYIIPAYIVIFALLSHATSSRFRGLSSLTNYRKASIEVDVA